MSWRAVTGEDLSWCAVFLREHLQTSMFFLSAFAEHGVRSDAPRGLRLWRATGDAPGLFALSNEGMIFILGPEVTAQAWQDTAPFWQDRGLIGALGESAQSEAFLEATGLQARPMAMSGPEPSYTLDTAQIVMPDCQGARVVPIDAGLRDVAVAWRGAFRGEAMGTPVHMRCAAAECDIVQYIAQDSHRILLQDDVPVAMTGFNARVPDVVQIGGVYTPPEARGRGLARRAVALHLAEARTHGARRAVLCAANAAAARAYEAIGFTRNGSFSMTLFSQEKGERA